LWPKYGVKYRVEYGGLGYAAVSPGNPTPGGLREKNRLMRRFLDNKTLTGPIGWAYNPATERGAALALGQGELSCLVKLLIMMSERTTGNRRLPFVVE
jgi:hypothetical protein